MILKIIASFRESLSIIKDQASVQKSLLVEIPTKESMKRANSMVKEPMFGLLDPTFRDNLLREPSKEKENGVPKMERYLLASINMIRKMVLENIDGLMELHLKVNSKMTNSTSFDKQYTQPLQVCCPKGTKRNKNSLAQKQKKYHSW